MFWPRLERSKFSAAGLIRDNYETLRNYESGRPKPSDYIVYIGAPLAVALTSLLADAQARNVPEVLAAVAILTGLIFNVFVLIFDLSARALDRLEGDERELMVQLADELRANVSYAVLVGILLTILIGGIAMFAGNDRPLNAPLTAIVVFGGLHLLLTIFMVLKRVRAMFFAFRHQRLERSR